MVSEKVFLIITVILVGIGTVVDYQLGTGKQFMIVGAVASVLIFWGYLLMFFLKDKKHRDKLRKEEEQERKMWNYK